LPVCGAESPEKRVLRGGSFNNNQRNARCAYRNNNDPDNRNDNIGFRVVVSHDFYNTPEMRIGLPADAPRRRIKAGATLALAALPYFFPRPLGEGLKVRAAGRISNRPAA
jgi:hypothetical protein